jgi:sporulation protein YlmC with PRC-barrel domain
MVRATELVESPVEDAEGRNIGRLDDAVLNLTTSQLLLLDLRPAAPVEATDDNYLVPVAAFTGNRETTTITYDIAEYGLTGPSGFTGSWPDVTSNEYHARLARFWNTRDVATRYGAGMAIVPVRLTSASTLAGYELFSRESTSPGSIVDTLVNPDGSIDYVLIEFGEFLGSTDQRSAVPVSLLSIQPGSMAAVLNVLAGDLSGLPRYTDQEVVNTSASGWDESIRRYWNNFYDIETGDADLAEIPTVGSVEELSSRSPVPASALLGFEVVAADGSTLGGVDSLQIDLIDSSVGFAAVSLSDGLFGGARVPVPVSAMEWRPAERSVVVDATRDQLEQAPGYDDVPAQPELGLLRDIESYWSDLGN